MPEARCFVIRRGNKSLLAIRAILITLRYMSRYSSWSTMLSGYGWEPTTYLPCGTRAVGLQRLCRALPNVKEQPLIG